MAKAILLVQDKKPVGVFIQLKKTYGAIESLEGLPISESCDEISTLILPFPKESRTCNYARLTKFIADHERAALFTESNTETPKYTIFLFEMNRHPYDDPSVSTSETNNNEEE